MKTVYLETSIFGYLTGRPPRDLLASARQQITDRWWHDCRHRYEFFVSPVVEREGGKGDPEAASRRQSKMAGIPRLAVNAEVERLAERLILERAIPRRPRTTLCTSPWRPCIASTTCSLGTAAISTTRRLSRSFAPCAAMLGYPCPEICTPEELTGGLFDEG